MEVVTLGLGAAAAYISKDGIEKLLGPTADYLGKSLAEFTQKRVENVARIFKSAEEKLGPKLNAPGEVPPKVLKAILDEGSFSNDPLATEYFGGILASSRSEHGRDDRGARLAKTVDSLSTYQLRAHFLIYSSIRKLFSDKGLSVNFNDRPKMEIFVPFDNFVPDMGFSQTEVDQINSIVPHIFFGLSRDGLIEEHIRWGRAEGLRDVYPSADQDGIVLTPSAFGVELYLSVFGHIDKPLNYIFNSDLKVNLDDIPMGFGNTRATKRIID